MANYDIKMSRLEARMAKIQAELRMLEAEKNANAIYATTPWVNSVIQQIKVALLNNQQKSPHALMSILIQEFGNGKNARKTRAGTPVAPKYRDTTPGQEHNVWSGRGIAPRWLQAHEAAGRKREEFLIQRD